MGKGKQRAKIVLFYEDAADGVDSPIADDIEPAIAENETGGA